MANEFKIKKGLIVTGASGGTVVDIQGSQGQLFSVTDNLSGSIFAVSDISGVPIFDVNSSGLSTFDGNVNLPDNKKILVGTGNDLEIYHDGSNSYIDDVGAGSLYNRTTLFVVQNTDSTKNSIIGNPTADVKLYYNGVKKFETTSTGVTVTGNVTITGTNTFLIESNNTAATFNLNSAARGFDFINNNATLLSIDSDGNGTFADQAFSAATSSGDASSTLTTKGYVDSLITGATIYRGTWDPDVSLNSGYGNPNLNTVTQTSGYYYICSADGAATPNGATTEPNTWSTGDWVIWNDDIGASGEWQKIDNSSVLSGVGTGQTVALWEGASSVTDSETLGNAPITVSGTATTFAGSVKATLLRADTLNNNANSANIIYRSGTDTIVGNNANALVVEDGGNVGIGTDSPDTNLEIESSTGGVLRLTSSDTTILTGESIGRIEFKSNDTSTGGDNVMGFIDSVATNVGTRYALSFGTGDAAAAVERMRITNLGGISFGSTGTAYGSSGQILKSNGNASPTWIDGSAIPGVPAGSGTVNTIPLWTPDGDTLGNSLITTSGNDIRIPQYVVHSFDTNTFFGFPTTDTITFSTDASERIRITSSGNVGIGETDPSGYWGQANNIVIDTSGNGGITIKSTSAGNGRLVFTDTKSTTAGNTDGGMIAYNHTDDEMRFQTNGGQRIVIDSDGNVGIGVTNPSTKLQVAGIVQVVDGGNTAFYSGNYVRMFSTQSYGFRNSAGSQLALISVAGDSYFNGGNVGIGTTAPTAQLEIRTTRTGSPSSDTNIKVTDDTAQAADVGGSINFTGKYTDAGVVLGGSPFIRASKKNATTGDYGYGLKFGVRGTGSGTSNVAMTIDSDSNVGIGTSTPNAKLDIQGTQGQLFSVTDDLSGSIFAVADISGVPIFDVNSSGVSYFDGNVGIGTDSPVTKLQIDDPADFSVALSKRGSTSSALKFTLSNPNTTTNSWKIEHDASEDLKIFGYSADNLLISTNSTERMRITSGGNVGIGATSPRGKLQINGNGNAWNDAPSVRLWDTTNGKGWLVGNVNNYTAGDFYIRTFATVNADPTSASQEFTIKHATGNVGIGTTGPGYKLDVTGTIRATGDVIAYSDVRVKENIKTIDNSLEKVSKLRGVEFNKIGDNEKSIGVIAQEIEKVIPEVVKEDDKGMKSVAYGNISGLLIEAIKELKAEIEELKSNKCNCNK